MKNQLELKRRRLKKFYPRSMHEAPLLYDCPPSEPPQPYHALLINPFYPKDPHGSFGKHVLTPSRALVALAGSTPPEWTVTHWDENLLLGAPPLKPFPQVVGITVHLTFAKRAYELSRWYRRRGALVVLGGPHTVSCPEEAAPHADALAIGEGVQLWPRILSDAAAGALQPSYRENYHHPYREEPPPRREILDRRGFLTTAGLIATRGCHNRCSFCYLSTNGLHIPQQSRDVEQVVEEFLASRETYAVLIDNNLASDREYLLNLCQALRPHNRIWSAAVSVELAEDPQLVREMALAGCTGVFVGFESLNETNLIDSRKKGTSPAEYARFVQVFHQYGIQINGSFVFGFDHDEPDVFAKTIDWIEKQRLACATFHILTPYPGTPLFRQFEAEGRLLHRNWDLYDTSHAVFRPRRMSPEELETGYAWCYQRLFSLSSIWKRKPSRVAEFPAYFGVSYLYKKMNLVWPFLIRRRLTHALWRPFIAASRYSNLRHRRKLERDANRCLAFGPVSPGV